MKKHLVLSKTENNYFETSYDVLKVFDTKQEAEDFIADEHDKVSKNRFERSQYIEEFVQKLGATTKEEFDRFLELHPNFASTIQHPAWMTYAKRLRIALSSCDSVEEISFYPPPKYKKPFWDACVLEVDSSMFEEKE